MGRYFCGLLLALLSGSPALSTDVTGDLINLVVYFENVAFPDSWLGFTQDNQTMTINIPGDSGHSINIFNPDRRVRNLILKSAGTPDRYDQPGGSVQNDPEGPIRGKHVKSLSRFTFLQDTNVAEIKFRRQGSDFETSNEETQWRVQCEDESMQSCVLLNVAYHQLLFSRGANQSLGTSPGCEGDSCPVDCNTDADCITRGQCVFCQSNECRVSESCCSCSTCSCDNYDDAALVDNCNQHLKCGFCGQHCLESWETCPQQPSSMCLQELDKPEPVLPPLSEVVDAAKWRVLVPDFVSQVALVHQSGCNRANEVVYESIAINRGISINKQADWPVGEAVVNELRKRIAVALSRNETDEAWMKELGEQETWGPEDTGHLEISIPYNYRVRVSQLQGMYGSSDHVIYTVHTSNEKIEIEKCPQELRPECVDNNDDGSAFPECPGFWDHFWDYEPKSYRRPHETNCGRYWQCERPEEEGVPRFCLQDCGSWDGEVWHKAQTFDWLGSQECQWTADCSYVNTTESSRTTTQPPAKTSTTQAIITATHTTTLAEDNSTPKNPTQTTTEIPTSASPTSTQSKATSQTPPPTTPPASTPPATTPAAACNRPREECVDSNSDGSPCPACPATIEEWDHNAGTFFRPHASNCQRYWWCEIPMMEGVARFCLQECGEGLLFDMTTQNCVNPDWTDFDCGLVNN